MSTENDKFEKMDIAYELLRFIDLMVRQNCRRAHYEHLTRTRPSKEDKDNIYATDNLKKVYDKPRENIYQLLKNAQKTLKGVKGESVGPLPKKYWRYTKQEHKLLHDFLRKVQDHTPKSHFVWLDLQHYLFYVYRNFACPLPKVTSESLSAFFVCEMRELVTYLRTQDESQIWMRVFTLLREYCIFAQWHYSHSDKDDQPLRRFIAYYEAMLTAAKSLVPVFLEFERGVIYKNYQVCWIDFNTFLFIRFFYESDRVKTKVDECLKNKKIHADTPQTYSSMVRIKRAWAQLEKKAAMVNQSRRLPDHTQEGIRDKRALAAHKKLLTATFWIERSKEVRKIIDMDRLDDNIFDLLKDKHFFPEGPGLNKNGQCICEECLIAKYKSYLNSNEDFSLITTEERTTYCRKCHVILNLDQFQRHVNSHIEDLNTSIVPPKALNIAKIMDVVKLGDSTVQLSEMFSDKLKVSDKYGDGIKVLHKNDSRTAYENFHGRKDIKLADKLKSGLTLSLREELITNGFIKPLSNDFDKPIIPRITTEKLAETELMLRDMRKLGHVPLPKKNGRLSHCQDSSEPPERQNRCTCTYCELFAVPKIVDPRAKLRMRAHRRKDKKYENDLFKPFSSLTNGNNHTPTDTTKAENRVPTTPEPLRLPTIMEDGSDTEVSKEGKSPVILADNNRRKSKAEIAQRKAAEIAQKKAAKKARQREKKEQEKLEAELESQRKLEEMVRAEDGEEQSENYLEEMKSQEEAKMKKKLKKARQAEKRANMIQENIPAVVTIRRVPGGENGTPSVTITLKGCTPVQDKLLTKLVEPKVEVQNLIFESNQALPPDPKDGKKKNKGPKPKPRRGPYKKPAPPEPPVSKIIARDVKVTLAVDPTPDISLSPLTENKPKVKEVKREREPTEDEIKALGNLRLPPGITITKVEGPVNANKNYVAAETSSSASSVLGKSGVIVVDTEKLIQKTKTDISNQNTETQKKKKKKSKKVHFEEDSGKSNEKPKMVTLRNPMFQQFQAQNLAKAPLGSEENAPAAIFTSENGMVTIRSSRLQQSIDNGLVAESSMGMPLMPDLLSPVTSFSNPNSYAPPTEQHVNGVEEGIKNKDVSSMDAQEILSGLPGIEITKIDKTCDHSPDLAEGISCDAQVSIIPSNGTEFNLDLLHDFDKDEDWIYGGVASQLDKITLPFKTENVFKPRDVLEEDMDDEELELEAFKRFCQQSVPPKQKAVAHFNVSDIVLKKKLS